MGSIIKPYITLSYYIGFNRIENMKPNNRGNIPKINTHHNEKNQAEPLESSELFQEKIGYYGLKCLR